MKTLKQAVIDVAMLFYTILGIGWSVLFPVIAIFIIWLVAAPIFILSEAARYISPRMTRRADWIVAKVEEVALRCG